MKIDVVGAGSIGLLLGGRLAAAGADVTIWTRSDRQAELLREEGAAVYALEGGAQVVSVKSQSLESLESLECVRTTPIPNNDASPKFIFLTVKQTDIDNSLLDKLEALAHKDEEAVQAIVCLQNGIGHMELLGSRLPNIPILAGVTTEGARRLDERSVQHTGQGQLWIGEWGANERKRHNCPDFAQKMLISMLQLAGFTSFLSNDMNNRIYHKLLINAVINPLTALFDVNNGELPAHPSRVALMRALYAETAFILKGAGMQPELDGWAQIIEVCERTSGNVSSMLSDVRAGRITEIGAINGAVVRLAERQQLQAPYNRAVTELVDALSKRSEMGE